MKGRMQVNRAWGYGECRAMRMARRLKPVDVIELLSESFMLRRVPGFIRSGNVGGSRAETGSRVEPTAATVDSNNVKTAESSRPRGRRS